MLTGRRKGRHLPVKRIGADGAHQFLQIRGGADARQLRVGAGKPLGGVDFIGRAERFPGRERTNPEW